MFIIHPLDILKENVLFNVVLRKCNLQSTLFEKYVTN